MTIKYSPDVYRPGLVRATVVLDRTGKGCTVLTRSVWSATSCDFQSLPSNSNTPTLLLSTMSNFQSILDAVDKYATETGINLKDNPFAAEVKDCDSPDAVLLLLQKDTKAFKDYRDKNRKFIDCLSPVVKFVHAFSGVLGEAAGLVSREHLPRSLYILNSSDQGAIPSCKTNFCRN